ncbi:L-histidine N(alpha)-methyltransferase [Reichenbachiella ulvae]|uniref:L-histidine N(Alpha)-methyltransferase n=1 Tax=Reichenbachiella ulvae TaxID=2980104 RepID=A0ABT3D0G3_9BACT|nr:L-histidine N(alpha)-methyltransferase [Reichenbachiella ulvae]MCV9389392.1 L-histidine N(alpha)-methyltransferase [Reichenbachiella ulvae]
MIDSIETKIDSTFLVDVLEGLRSNPKRLSSKYFYNEVGDQLFQKIMKLEEYYLTNAEHEIFQSRKEEILKAFSPNGEAFNLVEFGAGDGYKTKVLLKHFITEKADFEYMPIDISAHALEGLEENLKLEIPELKISPLQGDYFQVLDELSHSSSKRNIILFLGSNIGNFTTNQAINFLSQIRKDINPNDLLFIGIDLKKDPDTILAAYNDKEGVTAEFNLNLLRRINCELDADFDVSKFRHYPHYNADTGECKSSLISLVDQEVTIAGERIHLKQWESIQTEISKKYDLQEIEFLAKKCGFVVDQHLEDDRGYFVDSIWRAV